MDKTTVIIGAGLSGMLVARELLARGRKVLVLDKSRGVGGRMATKRIGNAVFDQGAQFFTTRDEQFEAMVTSWAKCGVVERWAGGEDDRWVARPSMTGLAKALAADVPVTLSQKVQSAQFHESCGCWEIEVEGEGLYCADRIVFSSPVPQSLAILDAGHVKLPGAVRADLERCDYYPCLALMVVLDRPSDLAAEGVVMTEGPIRWVVDNVKKGIAQAAPAALTLHLNREFSAQHYGATEDEIWALVGEALRPIMGGAEVSSRRLHRWRFSEPKTLHRKRCEWVEEMNLGFCGDVFGGPRVEGAAISGMALARRIITSFEAS
jgi:renalase